MSHPETCTLFPDDASLIRVKRLQREYFLGLFAGRCDSGYVENRLRAGAAHERGGLLPKWYIGAYGRYLRLLLDQLLGALPEVEGRDAYRSLVKLIAFDMVRELARHRDDRQRNCSGGRSNLVHLGVDLSAMLTRSRLEDALELGLSMLGKTIRPRDS